MALLAVRDLAASGQWDAVVVDCAPTAETLRLLALPEALGWYLQKVFPTHRRLARGMRPLAVFLGRSEAIPSDGVFQALLQLADELESVRAMLADPTLTTVRLVLTPEAVVTAEARRTFTALALYGYAVDLIIANRVFPAGRDAFRSAWTAAQRRQLEVGAAILCRAAGAGGRLPAGRAYRHRGVAGRRDRSLRRTAGRRSRSTTVRRAN